MRTVKTRQQERHHLFIKCVAVTAAIFLLASACAAQNKTAAQPEVQLPQELKNPALLTEFGQLLEKIQHGVQLPPERSQSRLLPLQQRSTIFYAAFPNYGEASHQALTIFQQELQQSPLLRAWWQHGELAANGPKIEDAFEKFYQFSQFLGDEMTMSIATEGRQGPSLLILAEIRKPGLNNFLQQMANQFADHSKQSKPQSNPPFHVFDLQKLAAAKEMFPPQQPVVLVRPDFMVGTLDLGELKRLNAHLDANSREFVASPFGRRVAQAYEGGATVIAAADLQKLLQMAPHGTDQNQMFLQRSGLADVKYLVWEHKSEAGQATSQMELSFTGPRHGVASWLRAPGPMGSLDFVSPKAVVVSALLLKDPAQIFDELKDLATASNSKAFATETQMEAALKLSLREDLLRRLDGEITIEVDSLKAQDSVWKVILKVNDTARVQSTLQTLLATVPVVAQKSGEEGITYHTLRIPSGPKPTEIAYAFVDSYLVITSSHATLSEAIRLRRSGESLAKSQKFLASLPPGHGSVASAIFYENPTAVAALSMGQFMPGMMDSLLHGNEEAKPVMACAYGEETAIREVSQSSGVDAGAILIGAAIAIPNVLRARIAANESSAIAMIRTANTAQIGYSTTYPQRGFARDLATLGPDPRAVGASSADHASFIDATLGNASCTAGAWCTKSGYQFNLSAVCKKQTCDEYVVVGTPVTLNTGTRSFCSTSDAVVRYKSGPPLTSPVSLSECRSWSHLQ